MRSGGDGGFEALLGWVEQHYPGGERQLLHDAGVNRRTLQRWHSQGAPERNSKALDAVDVAVRQALPSYPPAGYPGGGLPALVGDRAPDGPTPTPQAAEGPVLLGPSDTGADGHATEAGPVRAAAPPAAAAPHTAAPGPVSAGRSRWRDPAVLAWILVVVLSVGLVVVWVGDGAAGGSAQGDPIPNPAVATDPSYATVSEVPAPAGRIYSARVDTSRPGTNPLPFVSAYSRPAMQENCDGVICPGSSRSITVLFDGDPINFTCLVRTQLVEAGSPGEVGWYGDTIWLKLVTPNAERWISNTWVLRKDLPDTVPTCP